MKPYLFLLAAMALMSLIAFFAYGLDKRKAKKGAWRTKESVLLGLGFFGGAIGALLGMNAYRHKTKHWYFRVLVPIFTIINIALVCASVRWK